MTVVDLYTIQILDDTGRFCVSTPTMDELMAEMEENLTDLLPDGWQARIRRWDHPDPEDNPGEEQDD